MQIKRQDVEKEIKEKLGFVPGFYSALADSVLPGGWSLHDHFELAETVLDNKTKELIGLAVASHIKCKYCIYFHTRAAETFGASRQEVGEAIAMGGLTVLFSNAVTGTQTDYEQFKRDVDRAIEMLAAKAAQS